jgi:hypothetical protein
MTCVDVIILATSGIDVDEAESRSDWPTRSLVMLVFIFQLDIIGILCLY